MRRPVPATGLRVVLTGASGGIGRATRRVLTSHGARVAGIDLFSDEGIIEADITDQQAITAAIERAATDLGGIDVLINNAGIGRAHDSGDFPDEQARRVMDINFFGAWNTTAAAMPHLLRSKGHVVNVSSGLAIVDLPYGVAYSASKRAIAAYSAALAIEYRGRLTVTTVYPGYIRTAIHEAPSAKGVSLEGVVRVDSVGGAAQALLRACTHRPQMMTTSRMSTIELWAARRFPRATAAVVAGRMDRWARRTASPSFLRHPESSRWKA